MKEDERAERGAWQDVPALPELRRATPHIPFMRGEGQTPTFRDVSESAPGQHVPPETLG